MMYIIYTHCIYVYTLYIYIYIIIYPKLLVYMIHYLSPFGSISQGCRWSGRPLLLRWVSVKWRKRCVFHIKNGGKNMKNHWFYDLINFVSSRYWTNIGFHRYWNNIWPGCECPIVPLFTSKVPLSFSGPHGFVWEKTWQSRPPDFVSHPKNISKSSIYKICVSIVCMIHCLNPNLSGKPGNIW